MLILGVIMGWVESVYWQAGCDKPRDIDGEPVDSDAYSETPDIPVDIPIDIPEAYKRHIPVLEPDSQTPKSADRYVRIRR
jgi:hypothetical protein